MSDKLSRWRTSTFSGGDIECVELAWTGTRAGIRDSKAPNTGTLTIPAPTLHRLLTHTKHS